MLTQSLLDAGCVVLGMTGLLLFQSSSLNYSFYVAELSVSASLWIHLCGEKPEAPVENGISGLGLGLI